MGDQPAYGARGTLGFIDLSTCVSLTPEVLAALPDGVTAVFSRLRLPRGEVTAEALVEMLDSDDLERAAVELADAGVGAIVFACTSGSLVLGPGFDEQVAERIEAATGTPASTTASAVVAALREVGARTLTVGTPYLEEINRLEREFLNAAGFEVLRIDGLGLRFDREIGAVSLERVRQLALQVSQPAADAMFLSCTNLGSLPLVPPLEDELERPVVTSNSASVWQALRLINVVPGSALGRLASASSEAGVAPGGLGSGRAARGRAPVRYALARRARWRSSGRRGAG
jgi:maleate isomerase